jgi:hypothetical protein
MNNKNCQKLDHLYYNKDICNQVANIIYSATDKPTIINPKSNFVIVTYWWGRGNFNKNTAKPCPTEINPIVKPEDITTQPIKFEEMIENWKKKCTKANCNYLAIEYPEFAVKGGYQLAINAKPLFIKKALELCNGRAVVYIDGDMVVHKYPYIFDMKDYDYMARGWKMDPRASCNYNKISCFDLTTFETSGGIMYFNNTYNANYLLNKWISYTFNKTQAGKADDRIISLIISANKKFLFNLKILYLPIEFLWLTDKYVRYLNNEDYTKYLKSKKVKIPANYNIQQDIIIEHPECLTLEEIATKQGAAADRVPKLYETLVENKLSCKYAGYLWEYIFFENKNQLQSYAGYLRFIKTNKIYDEFIKAPYSIIKFADKYGGKFNKIANNNIKNSNKIKKLLLDIKKDNGLTKEYINVIFEENPNDDKKLHIEYDEEYETIYTNNVTAVIIALFSINKNAIFIPNEYKIMPYLKSIKQELAKNNELELIFSNKFDYLNIDKIEILRTPILFKNSRILCHLLHLINHELDFIETFKKAFKSSHLFALSIRIGLYKSNLSSSSSIVKEVDDKQQQKDLFNRFRFKLLKDKKETPKKSKSSSSSNYFSLSKSSSLSNSSSLSKYFSLSNSSSLSKYFSLSNSSSLSK